MTPAGLMKIDVVPDIYCDSILVDDRSQLLFMSLWGRDTALQQFVARLSLPASKDGLDRFCVLGSKIVDVWVPNADRLQKNSGRMPPNLFGEMTQMWLFDTLAQTPDRVNRRAIALFRRESDHHNVERIWTMIKDICSIPLLDRWREQWMKILLDRKWLKVHVGINAVAFEIDLNSEDIEHVMTDLIRDNVLTLNEPSLTT